MKSRAREIDDYVNVNHVKIAIVCMQFCMHDDKTRKRKNSLHVKQVLAELEKCNTALRYSCISV